MIQLANTWGLLALLAPAIIVVLFSLRPQRRTVVLASTLLWAEALRERQRGFGWQKLLKNVSLLALLLAAIAAAIALADPARIARSALPGDAVLIVDVSASMQTRTGGGTRFDAAIVEANALVDALPEDARMLIIASGRTPRLLSAFERDRRVLGAALDGLEPTDEAGRPHAALDLARSLLRARERGRIVFVTDAAFDAAPDRAGHAIEYRTVGEPAPNLAITRFDVRREIGATDRFQILLTARNYGDESVDAPVEIAADGRVFHTRRIALAPGGQTTFVTPFAGRIAGRVSARLDVDDALAADNRAYAVLAVEETLQIALYTDGNFYLESALAAMANAVVNRRERADRDGLAHDALSHDLVVLDGIEAPALPPGRYLLIDTVPPDAPFAEIDPPVIGPRVAGPGASALMRGLDLSGLRIDTARRVSLDSGGGAQRLFRAADTELALAYIAGDVRAVWLGFDIERSNFPLQAAFPLFIEHAAAWLRGAGGRRGRTSIAAGESYAIRLPPGQDSVVLRTPDGDGEIFEVRDGEWVLDATSRAGVYRYTERDAFGELARYVAVNLTDADESDVRPRAAVTSPGAAPDRSALARTSTPLWPWLAGLALLALVFEACLPALRRRHA